MINTRRRILDAFLKNLQGISDKEYQKRVWIKGEEADFDEAVCLFFGEGDPLLNDYKNFGITKTQHQLLKKFRNEFEAFSDANDLPQEFIDTPEWETIMNLAKEILEAFNYKEKND